MSDIVKSIPVRGSRSHDRIDADSLGDTARKIGVRFGKGLSIGKTAARTVVDGVASVRADIRRADMAVVRDMSDEEKQRQVDAELRRLDRIKAAAVKEGCGIGNLSKDKDPYYHWRHEEVPLAMARSDDGLRSLTHVVQVGDTILGVIRDEEVGPNGGFVVNVLPYGIHRYDDDGMQRNGPVGTLKKISFNDIDVPTKTFTVGSETIGDDQADQKHCTITFDKDSNIVVRDHHSVNGTIVFENSFFQKGKGTGAEPYAFISELQKFPNVWDCGPAESVVNPYRPDDRPMGPAI